MEESENERIARAIIFFIIFCWTLTVIAWITTWGNAKEQCMSLRKCKEKDSILYTSRIDSIKEYYETNYTGSYTLIPH